MLCQHFNYQAADVRVVACMFRNVFPDVLQELWEPAWQEQEFGTSVVCRQHMQQPAQACYVHARNTGTHAPDAGFKHTAHSCDNANI